jgi:hypothetical protein
MTKLTRRGFLGKSTASAATLGALLAMPGLADARETPTTPALNLTREELDGPIVLHVRNLSSGEVALLAGTRELVYHDRDLVKRLVKATRQAPHHAG